MVKSCKTCLHSKVGASDYFIWCSKVEPNLVKHGFICEKHYNIYINKMKLQLIIDMIYSILFIIHHGLKTQYKRVEKWVKKD